MEDEPDIAFLRFRAEQDNDALIRYKFGTISKAEYQRLLKRWMDSRIELNLALKRNSDIISDVINE